MLALGFIVGCSVPKLSELGDKRCDADHPCISGFSCQSGLCKVPTGMPCTGSETRACGTDVGECVRGTQKCVDGVFGDCEGSVGPGTESCNGKDDDCDGMTDEDLVDAPACELQDGVCAGAKKACVDGGYVATCSAAQYGGDYEATETRCDDKDNDCDGMKDEGVGGGACSAVGVCAGFQRACTAGAPGVCLAPGFEATETSCDNQDNDCDGMTDEGVVSSTPCALDAGVCAGKVAACRAGAFETTCTAASYGPDYQLTETLCDGLDNDCNGVVDRLGDGGFVRIGSCELSQGVCANVQRACIAGNGEAPCTAASYGPTYEASEFTCDGLDNDCDGRTDVSKEAALLVTPNAASTHLSLAPTSSGGSAGVYLDQRRGASRVFFRRFDAALRTLGNEQELSDPTATDCVRPEVVRVGADFAASWIETVGGVTRIVLVRVSELGVVGFTRVVASGVSVFKGPRVAANPSASSTIAVAWVGADLSLNAAVYDGSNGVITAPKNVVAASDAGGDLVFSADVVRRPNSSDFLFGWVAQSGGTFRVRFQAFNTALQAQGTVREETVAGETADAVRVQLDGTTQEAGGAWLGSTSSPAVVTLRWLPNALTSPQPIAASVFSGSSADLNLATVAAGTVAFWSQGLPTPRLVGLSLGGDAGVRDFTPNGVSGLFAPGVTSLDGGVLHVGYEADRGTGLDLFGQVVCRP
ncbi:MAG: MopE-related protein [Myxococcaceae bacterium]